MLFTLVVATLLITAQAPQHLPKYVVPAQPVTGHKAPPAVDTPYKNLFEVAPVQKAPESATPKLVLGAVKEVGGLQRGPCNMPIIAANADVDPKIIVPIPEHAKKSAKIRAIEPPKC